MKAPARKLIYLTLLFFITIPLLAQELTKKEFIKAIQQADISYYYDEDYEKVALLYENLLKSYPNNSNITAKLGVSYLNIDGKQAEALRLLKIASKNIVSEEKEYVSYGEKASLDTYLYLALAYHQNDSLQKAIAAYTVARAKLEGNEVFQQEFIEKQIRDCKHAIEMRKKPLTINKNYFAPWLSGYPGACNPVLSQNDSVFIFTVRNAGKTRILCSYKTTNWQPPVDITMQLGGLERLYSNSITGNGKELILYIDDGGDGNLYSSTRNDTSWTKIKSIRTTRSIYWESHGFITPDGKSLYFTSNRPGGEGELDIWLTERDEFNNWKPPVNCGNTINTPYNENTPFYDASTNSLIFSSEGHVTMGGYDVFRSVFRFGSWTTPIAMPYAFNTTIDNSFFILNNNASGFITSLYDPETGARNIYSVVAEDPADKIIMAVGTVILQDGMGVDLKQAKVEFTDLKKNLPPREIRFSDTSSYKLEVKPGDYQICVSHKGYKTDTINLNVPLYYPGSYIALNSSLIPDKVFSKDYLSIKNILFDFDSYTLNEAALSSLELIKTTLVTYPDLKIEVAGYTDARGSSEYNIKLADQRAKEVIRYFTDAGIASSRFVRKALGNSNFAAVNTNLDGSDNPEGRKYNRRVTFGIIDPQTGVTLSQETFTPDHLRQPYSMRYSIVLLKTTKNISESYFESLKMTERYFMKVIELDSLKLHVLGIFYNKTEAGKYLGYVRKNGFKDAYIVTQYEINSLSKSLINPVSETRPVNVSRGYTIQLKAARRPVNMKSFSSVVGVREVYSTDGYYRYLCGEFRSMSKAKEELVTIKAAGFQDAFIRDNDVVDLRK
jgi:outer membrane protein OmpA-like peptidoglycan-associated protein/tetratricopeptide (TPR) repeat protein